MTTTNKRTWKWLFYAATGLAFVGLWIVIIALGSGFRTYRSSSSSMAKTVNTGDVIVADLHAYNRTQPRHGDVIVLQHGEYTLIKRLIGLPGDSITMTNGKVTVNGTTLSEPYAQNTDDVNGAPETLEPLTVPSTELFLLGDNRDNSLDSRMPEFGQAHLADIRGKVLLVLTSPSTAAPHAVR